MAKADRDQKNIICPSWTHFGLQELGVTSGSAGSNAAFPDGVSFQLVLGLGRSDALCSLRSVCRILQGFIYPAARKDTPTGPGCGLRFNCPLDRSHKQTERELLLIRYTLEKEYTSSETKHSSVPSLSLSVCLFLSLAFF